LAEEVPVEIDGGVDVLHDRVGTGAEAPAPHLVAHGTSTEVSPTMTGPEHAARTHARKRLAMVAAGGIAGVAAGLAALCGIGTLKRIAPEAAWGRAFELPRRLAPLRRGEGAAFTVADRSLRLPDVAFRDAEGSEHRLADWRGRTMLLNLWATWCVPCRK